MKKIFILSIAFISTADMATAQQLLTTANDLSQKIDGARFDKGSEMKEGVLEIDGTRLIEERPGLESGYAACAGAAAKTAGGYRQWPVNETPLYSSTCTNYWDGVNTLTWSGYPLRYRRIENPEVYAQSRKNQAASNGWLVGGAAGLNMGLLAGAISGIIFGLTTKLPSNALICLAAASGAAVGLLSGYWAVKSNTQEAFDKALEKGRTNPFLPIDGYKPVLETVQRGG